LSTIWFDFGYFWNSYVLDITGPAWNYILFRGLFTSYSENAWTRLFTPGRTLILFLIVCISIETAQYLELYDSFYDPWDFIAYASLLIPFYVIDMSIQRKAVVEKES
jgi:hypothetical protein